MEGSEDINTKWQQLKIACEQTCKAFLGTKQRKRKEWISEDSWQAIEKRRILKMKVLKAKSERLKERYKQQRMEANRTVKMMARTEKQSHINDPPSQAEDAAGRGEPRKIYKIIRLVCVRYIVGTDAPMMDQQRRLLITEAEQDAA